MKFYEKWQQSAKEHGRDTALLTQAPFPWVLHGLLLAFLAGDLSDADAQIQLDRMIAWLGVLGVDPGKGVVRLPPAMLRELCRTAKGRDAARRFAFQDLSYAEYLRLPVLMAVTEAVHQLLLPGPLTADQEEVVWETAEKMHAVHQRRPRQLGRRWRRHRSPPFSARELWRPDPDLRPLALQSSLELRRRAHKPRGRDHRRGYDRHRGKRRRHRQHTGELCHPGRR